MIFKSKAFITDVTSKWFYLLMNFFDVLIHIRFVSKARVTCSAIIFYTLMNSSNMKFQSLLSGTCILQNSHLYGYFPSWTEATWAVKLALDEKVFVHKSHFALFFFSWTSSICLSILDFCAHLYLQRLQSYCDFPSWAQAICALRLSFLLNALSHRAHTSLISSWLALIWLVNCFLISLLMSQYVHWCSGLTCSCTIYMDIFIHELQLHVQSYLHLLKKFSYINHILPYFSSHEPPLYAYPFLIFAHIYTYKGYNHIVNFLHEPKLYVR